MKPRELSIVVLLLVVGAIGFWMWLGEEQTVTPSSIAPDSPVSREVAPDAPPNTAVSSPTPGGRSEVTPALATPTVSAPITSSVVPGLPLVRGTSTPPRRPGPVSVSRPEPPVEGKVELEKVQTMLRDYRTRMGGNPVGSNAEIMRAIMGGNEVKATLGPPEGQSLNGDGELVDRWGTPYFFHQLSKTSMEVRSAGPDGRMWTVDDLVTK